MMGLNHKLNEGKEQFIKLLLNILLEKEINELIAYLSNPAKYPQIVDLLRQVKVKIIEREDLFVPNDYITLCNWLDDELAFAILINQNSKCDPFKFIKF